MREPRNPFRLRAAEQIESELSFLRLFGPGMLELLSTQQMWERPQILRSAAGGGKTSILKLFTPSVVLSLHANRGNEDVRDLFQRMEEFGIVSEDGPKALGVLLPCNRNYANLEDIEFDGARRDRLFFGLLNARIILSMLRACLSLHALSFPKDLDRISLREGIDFPVGVNAPKPFTGSDLYRYATRYEAELCDAIDSFDLPDQNLLIGQDTVSALELLKPEAVLLDGIPVSERTVLMLDDVHLLTLQQRKTLFRTLAQLRSGVAIWIAERFEALSVDELLSSGTSEGRDYDVIQIEQFWRRQRKKFENLTSNVANRRARAATEVEFPSFEPYLVASLDASEWQEQSKTILHDVQARVVKETADQVKFRDWLQHEDLAEGTTRDRAIGWRMLEILIERERRKSQGAFDFALPVDDLEERSDSQIKSAAELFIAYDYKLPYYFGLQRLAALASSNMEQYLWLAGDQFEELISAAVVRQPSWQLSPARQDSIIRRASDQLWKEIPRRARFGEEVYRFLDSVARFCQHMTFLPNAPYEPGVTGIAISMDDRAKLVDPRYVAAHPEHGRLAEVLAAGIANNLLEPILDYKCKGAMWMVLNINRLLCPKYWLPLQYGGFKEKRLDELGSWLLNGYRVTKKTETLL
jgi:hypothetical protein